MVFRPAGITIKSGVSSVPTVGTERFINVRKLAALDIVYRGERRILLEFGFGVFFLGLVGIAFLLFAHQRTPLTTGIGTYLLFLGVNYVPLFVYAISISLKKSARKDVAYELAHEDIFRKKYGVQQTLILVPLAVVLLAAVQKSAG